jgi:hypothetical protein
MRSADCAPRSTDGELLRGVPANVAVSLTCLEEQYGKVVGRKSWPLVTDIA